MGAGVCACVRVCVCQGSISCEHALRPYTCVFVYGCLCVCVCVFRKDLIKAHMITICFDTVEFRYVLATLFFFYYIHVHTHTHTQVQSHTSLCP
jgi:hypothetical protein